MIFDVEEFVSESGVFGVYDFRRGRVCFGNGFFSYIFLETFFRIVSLERGCWFFWK